jgi:hypothetical protein
MTDGSNFKTFYGTNSYMPGLFGLYAGDDCYSITKKNIEIVTITKK